MSEYVLAAGRIILPLLAVLLVARCMLSLVRTRPQKTPLAMVVNLANGDKIIIDRWETSVGRHEKCDIVLNYNTVSRYHAVISRRKDGWAVTDTHSKTGVFVNENKVEKRSLIYDGDTIAFGNALFSFHTKEEKSEEATSEALAQTKNDEVKTQRKSSHKLTNKITGDTYILHAGENRIGRDKQCDIVLSVQSVSRNHASIGRVQGEWIIRDNGSRSGTYLNGQPVLKAQWLKDGDTINVGGVELIFNG